MDFGSYSFESWLQHVPLPHILDLLIQVLSNCDGKDGYGEVGGYKNDKGRCGEVDSVPSDILEDILPSLCFSLPRNAQGCVAMLHNLPQHTQVWEKLEEGLRNQKYLPVEITISLYTTKTSALENEIIRVLNLYADNVYNPNWREDSSFTVARFRSLGESVDGECETANSAQNSTSSHPQMNHWAHSPVIAASAQSSNIFSICLSLLFMVVENGHSLNSVHASSNFFSQVFNKAIQGDLYVLFPTNIQHLVYLLTLPLTSGQGDEYFQNFSQVSVVQEALVKALSSGGTDTATVRSLLCFFPFWLPVLDCRKFLDRHLVDWWCEF